jgi:hypothetical protein
MAAGWCAGHIRAADRGRAERGLRFPPDLRRHLLDDSHQGLQEQLLMSAPLIIHDGRDGPDQQEVVLMLHDFIFRPPEEIYAKLRGPMNMAGMAMKREQGPDLNDVTYDAFLANDRTGRGLN